MEVLLETINGLPHRIEGFSFRAGINGMNTISGQIVSFW
jgi:hypothetical protein